MAPGGYGNQVGGLVGGCEAARPTPQIPEMLNALGDHLGKAYAMTQRLESAINRLTGVPPPGPITNETQKDPSAGNVQNRLEQLIRAAAQLNAALDNVGNRLDAAV